MIIEEHYKELRNFYKEFISDEDELEKFLVHRLEDSSMIKSKRMLNTVQRFCFLSDEMMRIKPGKSDLSILFLVTCIESLYNIMEFNIKKNEAVIDFCCKYIEIDDLKMIEEKIDVLHTFENYSKYLNITVNEFALLLVAVRNNVVHEGVYWSLNFQPEHGHEFPIISVVNSKLKKDEGYSDVTYINSMTYLEFRKIIIKAFIKLIRDYQ